MFGGFFGIFEIFNVVGSLGSKPSAQEKRPASDEISAKGYGDASKSTVMPFAEKIEELTSTGAKRKVQNMSVATKTMPKVEVAGQSLDSKRRKLSIMIEEMENQSGLLKDRENVQIFFFV